MLFVLLYSLIVKLRESECAELCILCLVLVKLAVQATQTLHMYEVRTSMPWFAVV